MVGITNDPITNLNDSQKDRMSNLWPLEEIRLKSRGSGGVLCQRTDETIRNHFTVKGLFRQVSNFLMLN